jgi:hypothetical protein
MTAPVRSVRGRAAQDRPGIVRLDLGQGGDRGDAAPRKVGVGSRYSLEQLDDSVCLIAASQPSDELGYTRSIRTMVIRSPSTSYSTR